MGKIINKGLAKPDDPIFSTGPEISSNHTSRGSSRTSSATTDGAAQGHDDRVGDFEDEADQDSSQASAQRPEKERQKERELFAGMMRTRQFPIDQRLDNDATESSNSAASPPADLVGLVARRHKVSR
ncbi:hypothetical protein [Halomonas aquatica]|uniref:Uncharacterized protein n=1 Tax=Halomonas aquatica TaxID=3151123 RepID=A0ABV1NG24_9GAMM